MNIQKVIFSSINLNKENPRRLGKIKKDKLLLSLLMFPKMLTCRPQVLDNNNTVIGGNARQIVITEIYSMGLAKVKQTILTEIKKLIDKGLEYEDGRKQETLEFWDNFFNDKLISIVNASDFTESEIKEFIIKDNQSFGEWDFDMLSTEYDADILLDWGFDKYELGLNIDTDMELLDNVLSDSINALNFQMSFTFPTEHKEKFDKFDKKILHNVLLEYVNDNC